VYVDGVQDNTGAVTWELAIHANTNHPITSDQLRRFAELAIEAADEYDRLSG
jgi:hypothetical protein